MLACRWVWSQERLTGIWVCMVVVCTLTVTKGRECVERNSNYTPIHMKNNWQVRWRLSKQRHSQTRVIIITALFVNRLFNLDNNNDKSAFVKFFLYSSTAIFENNYSAYILCHTGLLKHICQIPIRKKKQHKNNGCITIVSHNRNERRRVESC